MSLFKAPQEEKGKGSHEWSTFDAIRGDRVDMFHVRSPKQRPQHHDTVPYRTNRKVIPTFGR